jgi:L-2-hydroxyglutarate oxidase LhgO
VHTITDTEVIGVEPDDGHILLTIKYRDGRTDQVRAKIVINAGGVEADLIACLCDPDSPFELDPIKGESYKFFGHKRPDIRLHGCNVYPIPKSVETSHGRHFTVGVHLTPTFEDSAYPSTIGSTVTIGPKLVPVKDRNSSCSPVSGPGIFINEVKSFFPGLKEKDLLWHQDGLQARLKGYPDFIFHTDPRHKNMINLLGIDSPGLTSCLAIARRVKDITYDLGL